MKAPSAYSQAKAMAKEGPVTISLLHRRLDCGYAAAARLIERLAREAKK